MQKIEMDIEKIVQWAYRDELSKKQTSSAEGIWDRIMEDGQRGGIDPGHGAAQRYSHFGLPDPDAERIEQAVGQLQDAVIDWRKDFDGIAGELSGLISVNDVTRRETRQRRPEYGWGEAGAKAMKAWWGNDKPYKDRPRDVLMVGGIRTGALITMHAIKGTRPDWREEPPRPMPTPAMKGPNAMIVGECKGKNLYTAGAHCPLKWTPSPLSIVTSRAEYLSWYQGLKQLSETIQLVKFTTLAPRAPEFPWLDHEEEQMPHIVPVMPTGRNNVSDWGTLPLAPLRDRKGPPRKYPKAGPVRYVVDWA